MKIRFTSLNGEIALLAMSLLARHPRLHVNVLPIGAPELSPMEWVWQVVDDFPALTAPHDRSELRANVMAGVARVRRSPQRLRAGFSGAKLKL